MHMKRLAPWFVVLAIAWSGCGPKQSTDTPESSAKAPATPVATTTALPKAERKIEPKAEAKVDIVLPKLGEPKPEALAKLVAKEPPLGRSQTPAVAGKFYPADKAELERTVDKMLADAKTVELKNLKAIVCPHAGYPYSGKIAAAAYKQLAGRDVETVIVMGPSHRTEFPGAALPDAESINTPLGAMAVAPWASKLLASGPFILDPEARVQTDAGEIVRGRPYGYEHSVETQIPFLQRVAPKAKIVPLIFGRVEPLDIARALEPYLDEHTLIVVSTDLSHYKPEKVGRPMDEKTVKAICRLEGQVDPEQACGSGPLKALAYLARQHRWSAQVLATGNSNDVTGEKAGVGYASIAFCAREAKSQSAAKSPERQYSDADRRFLLELARKTITAAVNDKPEPQLKKGDASAKLMESRGCFVTLRIDGKLRGCIGTILPLEPLAESVIHNARNAALYDRRFEPVKAKELSEIKIEISVLTVPQPLEHSSPSDLLDKLRPKIDGVVFKFEGSQSTFLPQVWEEIPNKEKFLSQLSAKAGLSPFAWRSAQSRFETYQVEAFEEGKLEK
jgi:AmmeMemoRadiSam system protein B/AmmeMemoRadiSam system protein A